MIIVLFIRQYGRSHGLSENLFGSQQARAPFIVPECGRKVSSQAKATCDTPEVPRFLMY